ncbi:hypothetical protein [Blastococcus sp. SYSU D00820]
MPKSRKRRKTARPPARRTSPEWDLVDALRDGVDSPTPGPLLGTVGLLLGVAASDDDPTATLRDLIDSFSAADRVETSAAALAIATLTADAELRRRVRREIGERGHVVPRWLVELDRTQPVGRAVEISTVFRDVDDLVIGAVAPGGHPLTVVITVDNELGAVATDGYVAQAPLEEVVELLTGEDDPDVRIRDLPLADAAARIRAALAEIDAGPAFVSSERLVESRALIEWLVSLLPEGGDGSVLQELSDAELDAIAERFLASPFGAVWTDPGLRPLVDEMLAGSSSNGIGDPLVWSPRNVAAVLDPGGFRLGRRTPHLDRAPDLLRDLIRFGHAERGLRSLLTEEALEAIDAAEDAFRAALRD